MNSVSFKSTTATQAKPSEKIITQKKGEITKEVDSQKSNAAKLMIGATAAAAIVIGGVLIHKGIAARKAAKKAFQEGFNSVEHIHIKETPAKRNAQAMIDRVEKLKAQENSTIKNNPYTSIDWDAKPISRTQALFEHKFPTARARDAYINPEFAKEFEALEKQGYKINVKNNKNGYQTITYIYPESSPIESKVIHGKVADLNKGYDWSADDSRSIRIKLKNKTSGDDTYTLQFNNHPHLGDTRYDFGTSCKEHWGDTGSNDKKDLFDRIITPLTKQDNSDEVSKCLQNEFKNALEIA